MNAVKDTRWRPSRRSLNFAIANVYLETLDDGRAASSPLLDVIKDEFDRRGRSDVNAVQALLLYNIGDKELTAGELRTRGYYLGSNVSYNVKKLVEMGFLHHSRSRIDRRSVRISLTEQRQGGSPHRRRASTRNTPARRADRRHSGRRPRAHERLAPAPRALSGPTRSSTGSDSTESSARIVDKRGAQMARLA